MQTKHIANLIISIAFIQLVFAPYESAMAKSDNHPIVTKSTSETKEQTKTTEENKAENKTVNKTVNKTDNQHKATQQTTQDQHKKDDYSAEKPLKMDSTADITKNLPLYLNDWMKYLNKKDGCTGDCTITSAEVLKLIEDPHITGQQAAVLGALVTQINNGNSTDVKYTLNELEKMFTPTSSIYSYYYKTALENINGARDLSGANEKLFGPTGSLSKKTHIVQNSLGDCFILSAINGLLNIPGGPEKLEKMIKRVPGKSDEFWVTLPGAANPIFVKLTQTKLAMYSHLTQGGEWLAVLSDAEARARRDNPESGIFQGGYQTQTLHLLTGVPYRNKALSPFTSNQVNLLKSLTKEQWSALESLSNKQLSELSTLTPAQLEKTLTTDQLKAFKKLTSAELATLQQLTGAQWNELGTLIYSNAGKIDLKLLKSLQPLTSQELTKQVEKDLNTALNEDKPPKIIGIETNVHDLTVIGFDKKTGTVTIRNPWGDTGWYNPITGAGPDTTKPKNATTPPWFDMDKGVFQVNISQLVESNFVTITVPRSLNKS